MLFGTSFRIPGEFIAKQDIAQTKPADFVVSLRQLFAAKRPVPASRHVQHRPFVFKELGRCEYVLRRIDTVRKPLEPPYSGPHRVVRRIDERTFVVDVNGVEKTLSTDQLKPAFLETADEAGAHQSQQEPRPSPEVEQHSRSQSATASTSSEPSPLRRRVSFSLPGQNAQSIGEGVAVAPSASPRITRRSRRREGLPPL
ncbi:hypothetical protein TKK_0014688 [Trichogramma kaykai]